MTVEELQNRVFQNLPPFVKESSVLSALVNAAAEQMYSAITAITALQDEGTTGKGLRFNADQLAVFWNKDRSESDITNDLEGLLAIHKARGTETGIEADLLALLGTSNFDKVELSSGGWNVDNTYPEDETVFIDSLKVCQIFLKSGGRQPNAKERQTIEMRIIPLEFTITYTTS